MDKPSELKPCPFCGGAARLLAWDTEENHADPRPDIYGCAPCEIYMEREEWNRRTPDRAALLEVARRAAACGSGGDDLPSAVAERVVAEYLAEREGE